MTKLSTMLPHDVIKGTVKQRYAKIRFANKKLFNSLMECKEDLSLKRAGQLLSDSFVPDTGHRLNVKVEPLDIPDASGVTVTNFVNGKPAGYTVMVPVSREGKIRVDDFHRLIHEATHVYQQACEPKITARIVSLNLTEKQAKRIDNFYQNVLNTQNPSGMFSETFAALRMKLAFRGLKEEDKLNALFLIKNNLRMEYLANSEGEKYGYKLLHAGSEPRMLAFVDEFLFNEKIDFVKGMLSRQIKKMRNK